MKRPVLLLLLFLVVIVLATFLIFGVDPLPADQVKGTSEGVTIEGSEALNEDPGTEAGEREEIGDTKAVAGGADLGGAKTLTVLGRCIDAETELGLPGCRLELRIGAPDGRSIWRPWLEDDIQTEFVTAADGRFRLELSGDYSLGCSLRLEAEGRLRRAKHWSNPEPVIDLGDIPIRRGIRVLGKVIDEAGTGVEGAFLLVARLTEKEEFAETDMHRATSDAAGRFTFPELFAAGEWWTAVQGTGPLVGPRTIQIESGEPEQSFEIRVQRPDPSQSIHGLVVDELGRPLEGIFMGAHGEGSIGQDESDEQGRFVIPRGNPTHNDGKKGVEITASDVEDGRQQERQEERKIYRWGQREVRIQMLDPVAITAQVFDANSQPIEDYRLHAYWNNGRTPVWSSYTKIDGRGPHAEGRFRLTGLKQGPSAVIVVPADDELACSSLVPFGPEDSSRGVNIELQENLPSTIAVVDAGGNPLADCRVEIIRLLFGKELETDAEPLRGEDIPPRKSAPFHILLDEAATGSDGEADLLVPAGRHWLRVSAAERITHIEEILVAPGQVPHRVTLETGASLFGDLSPAQILEELQPDPQEIEGPMAEKHRVALLLRADGERTLDPLLLTEESYRFTALKPGKYSLALRYWIPVPSLHDSPMTVVLEEFNLSAGEERRMDLNLDAVLPGRVSGRILYDGKPEANRDGFLQRLDRAFPQMIRFHTDDEGHFDLRIAPGEYRVKLALRSEEGAGWNILPIPGWYQVSTGAETRVSVDAPRRRMRIRIMDAEGAALANQNIVIYKPGYFRPGNLSTDGEGWVLIDPTPYGEFALVLTEEDGGKVELGPVELAADRVEGEQVLRFPQR
ncbi:MAG: carboxypeptidase-like regulatory domain-containing protein [Planctomycetota bacterium]